METEFQPNHARPLKITFSQMRQTSLLGVLVYTAVNKSRSMLIIGRTRYDYPTLSLDMCVKVGVEAAPMSGPT